MINKFIADFDALLILDQYLLNTHGDRKYPLLYVICYSGLQVETMLSLTGFEGQSLAAQAASGGDKSTFEAVSTSLRERLRPEKVK